MIRIGVDARSLEGERTGVGRYLYELLKEWKQNALSQAQFYLYFKKEIPSDIAKDFTAPAFILKRLPTFFGRPSNAFFLHIAFPWALRNDRTAHAFCPAYVAPFVSPVPFSVTIHDIVYSARPELYFWPSRIDRFLLPWLSARSARRAVKIFAPSQFTKSEIMKVWKIPEEKIVVTPEGVGDEFFARTDETLLIRERYGISAPFFLYVGSIFTRRHVAECIRAFEKIAQEFLDLQFFIAGKDRTRPPVYIDRVVQETNKQLGRNAVIRVDFIEPHLLPAVMRSAFAVVWLSDYEGFGLPALEAMASGTPLVTSHAGSLPEVVGNTAIVVSNPDDVREVLQAFRSVVSDETLRQQLRDAGSARARLFTWKSCAQQTRNAILDTL